MNLFGVGRITVFLKLIHLELRRANDIAEQRLRLDHPNHAGAFGTVRPKPTKATITHAPTVKELNDKWKKDHPYLDDHGF